MSGKRGAQSELTHDNWDNEEETEDRGTFKKADETEISRRVIKVGKRRSQAAASTDSSSIFSGFSGFKSVSTPSDSQAATSLTFGNKPSSNSPFSTSNGQTVQSLDNAKEANNNVSVTAVSDEVDSKITAKDSTVLPAASGGGGLNKLMESSQKFEKERHSKVFQHKLASLNKGVVSWITSHVQQNACVDLSPVFNDYKKHLQQIEADYENAVAELKDYKSNNQESKSNVASEDKSESQKSLFAFLNKKDNNDEAVQKPFAFGANTSTWNSFKPEVAGTGSNSKTENDSKLPSIANATNVAAPKPNLFAGFGATNSDETKSSSNIFAPFKNSSTANTSPSPFSGFTFTAQSGAATKAPNFAGLFPSQNSSEKPTAAPLFAGFASSPAVPPALGSGPTSDGKAVNGQGDVNTDETETDEPPKNDFKVVEEPGAYFSIRCKLFFKKENDWQSKGVGMLHFKTVEGGKTQLVLRADTSLGNIMLNVILDSSAPIKKSGKNMVSMVTIANPPVEEKCPQCGKSYPNAQESNECASGCSPKPTPLMFKVKTEEDCNNLFEKLKNPKS